MYMGKEDFPEPGDINKAYIDKLDALSLPNLVSHLQLKLEKTMAPQSSVEKMHSQHVLSLINITRKRLEEINS